MPDEPEENPLRGTQVVTSLFEHNTEAVHTGRARLPFSSVSRWNLRGYLRPTACAKEPPL